MKNVYVALCLSLLAPLVSGLENSGIPLPVLQEAARPVAECRPEKPSPGEPVEICYHAAHEKSRFSVNETVFAAVTIVFQEHGFSTEQHRMSPEKGDLVARFPLPANAAVLSVYFLTLSSESADTTPLRALLYTAGGRPVRNALAASMDGTNFLKHAEEELRSYPDNAAAYRDKWFFLSTGDNADAAKTVAVDMAKLQAFRKESPESLYAISYGFLLLKEEARGRDILKRMLDRFPLSPLTGAAVSSYFYLAMTNQIPAEAQADMDKAIAKTSAEFPQSAAARAWISMGRPCPTDLSIKICEAWVSAEDKNPYGYQMLAIGLNEKGRDLERAAWAIETALELTLAGHFRFLYDLFGKRTDFHLGILYQTAASIRFKLGDYVRSLAYLQAARNAPGAFPKAFFLEGEVWNALGNLKTAEKSFAEAWSKGITDARDKLRGIYEARKRPGASGDFETYLQALAAAPIAGSSPSTAAPKPAPAFVATDLEGKTIDLSSLRGKIVVLNFWFVGCGPCKAEIPELNKLVARFPEVAFIALSLTEPEATKKFLKENPFHYRMVASAEKIAEAYGVKVYPTHVVIDRRGNIYHQRFGGGPSIYDELAPLLERLFSKG